MTTILLVGVGFLSGVISGMGIGGGTLLIPAMTFLFALSQQEAQNINLIYFIPTAVIALITHVREKNIEGRVLWRLVVFGLAGAAFGAIIAVQANSDLLRKLFAGFLFLMGILECVKKESPNKDTAKQQ